MGMPDEINFMDLASLFSIGPETTLEKLGSAINASIFDASNMAGTLKQKGLIDFTASYPGPNTVTITDTGKALMSEAESKATSPYDDLDDAVLMQVSGGKRLPSDLQNTLNIRPKDLALRVYKLYKQGYLTYELKSGGVTIMLTDAGFLKSKAATPPQQPQPAQPQPSVQESAPAPEETVDVHELKHPKKRNTLLYALLILFILVIAFGVYYLYYVKKI